MKAQGWGVRVLLAGVFLCAGDLWADAPDGKSFSVAISTHKTDRRIKPLHGVNGGPKTYNFTMDTANYFREAGIPFARLHDVEYPLGSGEFVDIHCVFPDFGADPDDPASYNFTCTDAYIQAIVDTGCEVFYRLGESIDHGPIKKHVRPPKDFEKWARICEGIVRHYNEGWAQGFHHHIRYWEIWNEPENPPMWTGSKEEFFKLYSMTANRLKKRFPDLKIGGYASCGFYAVTRPKSDDFHRSFVSYFDQFLDYVSAPATKAPLDFFSWHIYNDNPREVVEHADYVAATLKKKGFAHTESCLNEWNYGGHGFEQMRQIGAACYVGGVLCDLQRAPVDSAMYYDAQPRQHYGGLFQYSTTPSKAYYPMKAFGVLYRLGYEAVSSCESQQTHFCAASDGRDIAAVLCNNDSQPVELSVRIDDLEPGKKIECYLLDAAHDLQKTCEYDARSFTVSLKGTTLILLQSK